MEREIIEFICPHCGHNKSYIDRTDYFEGGECLNCGKMSFYKKIKDMECSVKTPEVQCPYCKSFDTKKISTTSKVGSVALWGVFAAGKVSKQWHCNKCKSNF